jgi:phosphoglycerate dehydrogenase-like enzyme
MLGMELRGKRLGLVGVGRIGRAVAERAPAFGMDVVYHARRPLDIAAERLPLDRLLATSDVVSLHCPLTERTRGMIDDAALAAMKPGVLLINCARGPVIDRAALERALDAGKLGGVGIDTPWDEPWDPDDALFSRGDVIALPHMGGSTREAFDRIADIVADNIGRVARGEPPLYRVA